MGRYPQRIVTVVLHLAAAFSLGCGARQATSSAPAGQSAAPLSPPALVDSRGRPVPISPGGGASPAQADLVWTAPEGWTSVPPSSSMRRAQYALSAAPGDAARGECAVFYFGPGQGGDIQANVDRWASQFKSETGGGSPAPSVTEGTVSGMKVLKVTIEGTYSPSPMMGGDLTPKPGSLLLGAIIEGPDSNWFFKCTGPKKTLEAHRNEFEAMIGSIHAR